MALNARQRYFYKYTVSIYRLIDPQVSPLHDSGVPVMTDYGVYSLVASGVKTQFDSMPVNSAESPIGLTEKDILFTMDKWHFENAVDIEDTDCILVTGVPRSAEQMLGLTWIVQGNSQSHSTLITTNFQMVYAKLEQVPVPGVNA